MRRRSERSDLDDLVPALADSRFGGEMMRGNARLAPPAHRQSRIIQLGWAYQGSMFPLRSSTEWYEQYQICSSSAKKSAASPWANPARRRTQTWTMEARASPPVCPGLCSRGRPRPRGLLFGLFDQRLFQNLL